MSGSLGLYTYLLLAALVAVVAAYSNPEHTGKYEHCRPGIEFAVHSRLKDIPKHDLQHYHVFEKNNGKEKYYICRSCSLCGDGIKVVAPCWNSQNTKCGECIDPNHMYDDVTKSCRPIEDILGYSDEPADSPSTHVQEVPVPALQHSKGSNEIDDDDYNMNINEEQSPQDQFDNTKGNKQLTLEDDDGASLGILTEENNKLKSTFIIVITISSFVIIVAVVVFVIYMKRKGRDSHSASNSRPVDV